MDNQLASQLDQRKRKSVVPDMSFCPPHRAFCLEPDICSTGTTNHTKDGSVVRKCRVADKSASIRFSLWNEQAAAIESGDILRLTKGYCFVCWGVWWVWSMMVSCMCVNLYVCVCVSLFSGMLLYGRTHWFSTVVNMASWKRSESECSL